MLGLTAEQWTAVGALATAIGSFIAAAALWAAWRGLRHNTRALQVQVLEGIFRDIRELDRQYIAEFELMSSQQKTAWSASFFNTVEYLCFLIHSKLAPRDALSAFFFDGALSEWRAMFEKHVSAAIIRDNVDQFLEFKKAVAQRRVTRLEKMSWFGRLRRFRSDASQRVP